VDLQTEIDKLHSQVEVSTHFVCCMIDIVI